MSWPHQLRTQALLLLMVAVVGTLAGQPSTHRRTPIRNDLAVGSCERPDERIYTDHTIVESEGPSTLNGTLEIYVEAPIKITCVRIDDQVEDGTGATPWIHSGGIGHSWVFVGVQAQYGKGFNFKIHLFGVPDAEKLQNLALSTFKVNGNALE